MQRQLRKWRKFLCKVATQCAFIKLKINEVRKGSYEKSNDTGDGTVRGSGS